MKERTDYQKLINAADALILIAYKQPEYIEARLRAIADGLRKIAKNMEVK